MKISEFNFEQNNKIANEFLDYATSCAEYRISEEDLRRYTQQIVKENTEIGTSLGISLEEYYTSVLGIGEDGFYLMCAEDAEKEIKSALMIGALSQHKRILLDEAVFDDFCKRNNVNLNDNTSKLAVEYYCLKSAVIAYYTSIQLI